MSIQLYKPNQKNAGAAFTFSIGSNKNNSLPAFYMSAISQHSWDSDKKIGSFAGNAKDPDKTVNVKLSEFECGEVISAIRNRYDYSTFHSFDNNNTTIKFSPWDKDVKISKYDPESKGFKDSKIKVPAFGVSISKGKGSTFKIGMDPGEVEVFVKLLERFIELFVEEKINIQKALSKKSQQNKPSSKSPKEEKVEEVEEEEDFEDVPF